MIEQMIKRVFLQDEKDVPSPREIVEDTYRIRNLHLVAYPDLLELKKQINSPNINKGWYVGPLDKTIDGHWIIIEEWNFRKGGMGLLGVAHTREELSEKAYNLAKKCAQEYARSDNSTFIDLTSRGDKELADRLAKITCEEWMPDPDSIWC